MSVEASGFSAAAGRHAKWSWQLVRQMNQLITAYHQTRKTRPLGQKVKLGCIAFMFFWVPFLIPFIVYSYLFIGLAAVAVYATVVSAVWQVSLGIDRVLWWRGSRAVEALPGRLESTSQSVDAKAVLRGLRAEVQRADLTQEGEFGRISAALTEAQRLLPADNEQDIQELRQELDANQRRADELSVIRAEEARRALPQEHLLRTLVIANPTWTEVNRNNANQNVSVWSSSWIVAYDLGASSFSAARPSAEFDQEAAQGLLRQVLDDALRNRLAAGADPGLLTGSDSALLALAIRSGANRLALLRPADAPLPVNALLDYVRDKVSTTTTLDDLRHESTHE